jgi:lysozyme
MKKFLIVVVGLLITGFWLYHYPPGFLEQWLQIRKTKTLLRKGKEYYYGLSGEPVTWPPGHPVRGVDVSRYQTHVEWPEVRKNNIAFAFIKATEGFHRQDDLFAAHWQESGAAGVRRGAYHFYRPNQLPLLQAWNFIGVVELAPGDLPPVLDVETLGDTRPEKLREGVQIWLDRVENHFAVKPILYTNYDFYRKYLEGYFDDYPLWIAHYGVPRLQIKSGPRKKLRFWQLTDRGAVGGIQGRVDCNVFYGSPAELQQLCLPGSMTNDQ